MNKAEEEEVLGIVKMNRNGVTLSWENIHASVEVSRHDDSCFEPKLKVTKEIIRNITGIAKPGELLAIMGSSGAGKTTLLNVLNYRNSKDLSVSGLIKVSGQPVTGPHELIPISGYVEHDSLFYGTLTVKEHLKFQAMLRLEKSMSYEHRMNRVEEILYDLDLKKCENTLIGSAEKHITGISGGEKRRLTFATEVITDPYLLFCDEPTSGLDSFMAMTVVECMKKLANQGKTIICTIHQPSSEIFEMFDKLYLLAEGRLAYFGHPSKASSFFESQELSVADDYNPAEYYIEQLAILPTNPEECKRNVERLCNVFQESDQMAEIQLEIDSETKQPANIINSIKQVRSNYKSSSLSQFKWLLWRQSIMVLRDRIATRAEFYAIILCAAVLSVLYFDQRVNQAAIQNMAGFHFVIIAYLAVASLSNVIHSYSYEIPIFLREHHSGIYRVINYYLSKVIIELPVQIMTPLVFSAISYPLVNLNNNSSFSQFFFFTSALTLTVIAASALGSVLAVVSPTIDFALVLITPIHVAIAVVSGFLINYDTIPTWFQWLKYISYVGYTNEISTINQWSGVKYIPCQRNLKVCITNGNDVIKSLRMNKDNFELDFILLAVIYLSWSVLAFFALLAKSYRKN